MTFGHAHIQQEFSFWKIFQGPTRTPTTSLFSVFLLTRFPQGGNGIFFCYFAPVWALGTRRNCDPGWETQESNFLELRTVWEPPKMCPPYHATCRSQQFFRIKSNSLRAGNRISLRFWAAFGSVCVVWCGVVCVCVDDAIIEGSPAAGGGTAAAPAAPP